MYVCGPTVYGPPHLGHGRFSLVFDVLRRYLEWSGLEVTYVSNITDIDDKIIERANAEGRVGRRDRAPSARRSGTRRWTRIDVKRPTHDPHATAYVDEMVALIADLVDRGDAYETSDGVYFSAAVGRRLRAAGPPVDREPAGRRPGRGQRREALARRLRALEEGQAGRAVVAVAVGRRAAGLAHRVRRDVARPAGRRVRPPRRRPGPGLPAPRERAGPGRRPRPRLRPPLDAQRLRRGRRREDVEVLGNFTNLLDLIDSHRPARLPAAGAAQPLPLADRGQPGQRRGRLRVAAQARRVLPPGRRAAAGRRPTPRRSTSSAGSWTTTSTRPARSPCSSRWCATATRPWPSTTTTTAGRAAGRRGRDLQGRRPRAARAPTCVRSPTTCWRWRAERDDARRDRDWGRADALRQQLQERGYIVEDGPAGTQLRRRP